MPANLPSGLYLQGVNGAQHFTACLLDQLTEFVDQRRKLWIVLGYKWTHRISAEVVGGPEKDAPIGILMMPDEADWPG